MKQLCLLCLILACLPITAISQSCLPEGITFSNQAQIDSFQVNYPGCTEIEGNVMISGSNITNLNGLNVLISIESGLYISDNATLNSLTGLFNVTSIGGSLYIEQNVSLTCLMGLANLTSIGGNFNIGYNAALPTLTGLESLNSIMGSLAIEENPALTTLTGFNNVTTIGGDLYIGWNHVLTNLAGLDNVTTIGSRIWIDNNAALTTLTGLENVTSIGGWIVIYNNPALTILTGLENVTSIGGGLEIIQNDALTSLTGLDSIDAGSITVVWINDNNSLSTCDVQSICDFLSAPNGPVDIYDNAPGCNSQEEVEYACGVGLAEILEDRDCKVFPNPSSDLFTISFTLDHSTPVSLEVINRFGQVVDVILNGNMPQGDHQVTWNAEGLPPGIYFYRLTSGDRSSTGKVVVVR